MVAKVIKNDRVYEAALERIEALMDAAPDTPEGDELELLTTLVEVYEDKHFPINLPDPIEAIRFRMQQAGLKQQDLVPFIGSRSSEEDHAGDPSPEPASSITQVRKSTPSSGSGSSQTTKQ